MTNVCVCCVNASNFAEMNPLALIPNHFSDMYKLPNFNASSRGLLLIASLLLILAGGRIEGLAATAGVPERMAYQGFLTDGDGAPLGNDTPTAYTIVFKLFSEQSGGELIWDEQQTVTVDKGYFSVLLGEGLEVTTGRHPDLSTVFVGDTASDRYIEMTVRGIGAGSPPADVTILPRLRLLSSAYAFLAANAQGLVNQQGGSLVSDTGNGITVTGNIAVSGAITGDIDGSNITGNLNGSALVDRSVPDSKLSSNVPLLNNNLNAFTGAVTTGGAINGATWGPISSAGLQSGATLWSGFGLQLKWWQNGTIDLTASNPAYSVTCFIERWLPNGTRASAILTDWQGNQGVARPVAYPSSAGGDDSVFVRMSIHTNVGQRAEIVLARGVRSYFGPTHWRGTYHVFR